MTVSKEPFALSPHIWVGLVTAKGSSSGKLVTDTSVSSWITPVFHVHNDHHVKYDCFKGAIRTLTPQIWIGLVTGKGSPTGKQVTDTSGSC